jgi:hypothetical protein
VFIFLFCVSWGLKYEEVDFWFHYKMQSVYVAVF